VKGNFTRLRTSLTDQEEIMTRYLLGELSETEQASLEKQYFSDTRVFDQLVEVEHALADNYARGRLSAPERERFKTYYLAHPWRSERAKFAVSLATKLEELDQPAADGAKATTQSWWWRLRRAFQSYGGGLAFSAGLACLLLLVGSVWLFIRMKRLQEDLARTQATRAAQEDRVRELEQQLKDEQTRAKELTAKLNQSAPSPQPTPKSTEIPSPPAAPFSVSLALTVGGVRGPESRSGPTLVIPEGTRDVDLRLSMKESDYRNYEVILQPVGGAAIFTRKGLTPMTSKSGASFTLSVSSAKFSSGDYMLTLKGVTQSGELEDISKSLFRVEKK
jgi:anti-sigma factor RsiW